MTVIKQGVVVIKHDGYWWVFQDYTNLCRFLNSASEFVHPDCYWMVLK